MIISGGSRQKWRFFAGHLTNTKDNDRVELVEVRGLMTDTVYDSLREMSSIARGADVKNFFYHADINPREYEHLTPEQVIFAVDALEKNLGLEGQPRFVVEHEKEGRVHRHVIWSRIDTDTMTAISDSWDFKKHQQTSRELEQAFGHERVRDAHEKGIDGKQTERRPKSWEKFRGNKSGIDPEEVKAEVTGLWETTVSGKALHAALEENGYTLCKGDKTDFCIIDRAGKEHNLARRIDGVKKADVLARMADIDRDALPTVAEGREAHPERIRAEGLAKFRKRSTAQRGAIEKNGELEEIDGVQPSGSWWERSATFFSNVRARVADTVQAVKDWREKLRETRPAKGQSWRDHIKSKKREDVEPDVSR